MVPIQWYPQTSVLLPTFLSTSVPRELTSSESLLLVPCNTLPESRPETLQWGLVSQVQTTSREAEDEARSLEKGRGDSAPSERQGRSF